MIKYLSPSLKVFLSLVFTIVVACAQWHMTLVLSAIAVVVAVFLSGVKLFNILKAFKPLWFFIIVFAIITAVTSGGTYGGILIARFALITLGVSVLTETTSQTELQNAVISLLKPLKLLRVPTEDIAFVISLTLCFIPRITKEWQTLVYARQTRGIITRELTFKNQIKMTFLTFEKLIVNTLKIAEKTAISADSRCYGLGKFTPRNKDSFSRNDYGILVLFLIFCNFLILLEFLH